MEMSAGKLWRLRRLADDDGLFTMLAVDQRPPIKSLIAQRRADGTAPYDEVCAAKRMLVEVLGPHASAVLLDPAYAYPAAVDVARPGAGLLLTLEDSVFAPGRDGRRSTEIDGWSVAKIARAGADAVKVLAWYRPDAGPATRAHQEAFVERVGRACARHDVPFLLELLVYPLDDRATAHTDAVLGSVAAFSDARFGVDVFKLESPVPADRLPDRDDPGAQEALSAFAELNRLAGRPWVVLSAGATDEQFRRVLEYACGAGASGYLAGRAIWWDALGRYPDFDAVGAGLRTDGVSRMRVLNELVVAKARPWHQHPCYGDGPRLAGAGEGFRHAYPAADEVRA